MRSKLPTLLILVVMVLVGVMYWIDLSYYTDAATGFVTRGPVWLRFAVLALPLLMALLGLRTVGPRALAVMRVKNRALGTVFIVSAALGLAYGAARLTAAAPAFDLFGLALGILSAWYGVWMALAGWQLLTQSAPAPTKSAVPGVLAAFTFCVITAYRILVQPSSLHRVAPLVSAFSALFATLWFGMLLRALYIALPRGRVRWAYFTGCFAFLFCTCLELPQAVYQALFAGGGFASLLETLMLAAFGLAAAFTSVSIAGKSGARPVKEPDEPA